MAPSKILGIAFLLVLFVTCKKEEAETFVVTTGEIQYGVFDKIILTGTITPEVKNISFVGFRYSTDSTLSDYNEVVAKSISSNTFFSEIRNLRTDTKYYYAAYVNDGSKKLGKVKSFVSKMNGILKIDTIIRNSNSLDIHVIMKISDELLNIRPGLILTPSEKLNSVTKYSENVTDSSYAVTFTDLTDNVLYQAVSFVEIDGEKFIGDSVIVRTKEHFILNPVDSIAIDNPLIDPSLKQYLPKNTFQRKNFAEETVYVNPSFLGEGTKIYGSYQLENEDAVIFYGSQAGFAWIGKYNRSVSIPWSFKIGGSGHDAIQDLIEIEDGYITLGRTNSTDGDFNRTSNDLDYFVIKLNKSGNILWKKLLGSPYDDSPEKIFKLTNGNFLLLGSKGGLNSLIEIDGSGNLIKENSFSLFYGSTSTFALTTDYNATYIIGTTNIDTTIEISPNDAFIVKYQETDKVWTKTFGGYPYYSYDCLEYIFELDNGNLLGIGVSDLNILLVEITSSGHLIKKELINFHHQDLLYKAMQIDNKIYLYMNRPEKGYLYKLHLQINWID